MNYTRLPACSLTKGMTTYTKGPSGRFRRDVRLGDPFTTSGRVQPVAFNTVDGEGKRTGTVVYSPCATVWVVSKSSGRRNGKR